MASIFTAALDMALTTLLAVLTAVPRAYCNGELGVITRDVCVIGGGASGTYTAVRLHDSGKSVIVIEREGVLGGHTNTYVDPATNQTVDYGVVIFQDLPVVRDYLHRLDIAFHKVKFSDHPNLFVDTNNGQLVSQLITDYTPPDTWSALEAYRVQALKYPGLATGFHLSNPIPQDLLLTFGDFVQTYNLGAAVHTIASYAQGLGDILRQPTLYVLKNFGPDVVDNIRSGFLSTVNNHEIYDKALQILGPNVLLNSIVKHTNRNSSDYVEIAVNTPSGPMLIHARKLLVAIPPLLRNLNGFDLGPDERHLFGKFLSTGYYTGLVRNAGLQNTSIVNVSPDRPYSLAQLPGLYLIYPTVVPGLINVKYGSPVELSGAHIKADIISAIKRLQSCGIAASTGNPEFAAFESHAPFELTVSTDEIEAGFYQQLYALQGRRNTFYTGAAFHTHNSALLWRFTEDLLPRLRD